MGKTRSGINRRWKEAKLSTKIDKCVKWPVLNMLSAIERASDNKRGFGRREISQSQNSPKILTDLSDPSYSSYNEDSPMNGTFGH